MLKQPEREQIARLWARKLDQDAQRLPLADRHRNLEPVSADFLCALAFGLGAKRILEIGGSSGLSTIALAAAARATSGRLISIEREPGRQEEARRTLHALDLARYTEFILQDAAQVISTIEQIDFVFIDCEKDDYIRFFDALPLALPATVVADNILSHSMNEYVAHVRSRPNASSITLPIGKGLEVTRLELAAM